MCGIAGIFDFQGRPVEAAELERIGASIHHRGPDAGGARAGPGWAIASRRLAIIDLSPEADQPLTNEDGSLAIVYNGELYNYQELARELRARGHTFRSRSDTEVVLHAFEEWGPDCVCRFNGIFAFAIWAEPDRRLFLARDRFGVKPLYYAVQDSRFLFGSEVKALLEAGLRRRVSHEALVEYFTFQNVLSDRTLFDGVRVLPAGHWMSVSADGVANHEYWDAAFEPEDGGSEDDWAARIREAVEEAVRAQLVSDVALGSYLSGGMDSASIVAFARRQVARLMTFTGGFDLSSVSGLEVVYDERADAERVARTFGTEQYEMVIHAGDMAFVLPELVWHLEDLRVGMCYQNYFIARLASKFVTVALAGTGGDELFAGYPWRYDLVAGTSGAEFERRHYDYWTRLVPDAEKPRFFTPAVRSSARDHDPRAVYRDVMRPADGLDPLSKALYFELKTFLHGLLVVEDRVSMAHSLEVRVPFLDNRVVDLALTIPPSLKHDQTGKRLLRRAMRDVLPAEIVEKPKQGFTPPDLSWYRGTSMKDVRAIILSPRALDRGYFEPSYVERVFADHVEARSNNRLLIWSLMCFELWNRIFLDGETPPAQSAGVPERAVRARRSTRTDPAARTPASAAPADRAP